MQRRQQRDDCENDQAAVDDGDDETYLPNHAVSMRRALAECSELFRAAVVVVAAAGTAATTTTTDTTSTKTSMLLAQGKQQREDAREAARQVPEWRRRSLREFRDRRRRRLRGEQQRQDTTTTTSTVERVDDDGAFVDIVDVQDGSTLSTRDFRNRYQRGNVPCKLCKWQQTRYFGKLRRELLAVRAEGNVATSTSSTTAASSSDTPTPSAVVAVANRNWFLRHCVDDETERSLTVPVRVDDGGSDSDRGRRRRRRRTGRRAQEEEEENGCSDNVDNDIDIDLPLDDNDGRATECETKEMTLVEYFALLDRAAAAVAAAAADTTNNNDGDNNNEEDEEEDLSKYYLKDWHLVSWLRRHRPDVLPLYEVPECFGVDVLNAFLTRFTDGDYRFCYYGPAQSATSLHSDVLHSFSWSYNVCGTKEWTFYCPDDVHSEASENDTFSFVVRQEAGECMFVPAGWKHKVVNLEETLSINHNWVTSANVDLVWDCMQSEMRQIDAELRKWGPDTGSDEDMESRESMLRGCVGLDVTAYFFMLIYSTIQVLQKWANTTSSIGYNGETILLDDYWEFWFDLTRFCDMLQLLYSDQRLRLTDRLEATLHGKELRRHAAQLGSDILACIDNLYNR